MRGIVLAVLLTLVGSQKTQQTHHQIRPHFSPDKIHRYTYGATVYNKVQGKDSAVSAFKLTANVEIFAYKSNSYILKILNPQLGDYVGFHPRDQFEHSAKKTAAFLKCASKDISFEYRDSHVGSISAPPDTSVFCVNFARGILNMISITTREEDVYEVSEDGIGGECQTRYIADKKNDGCILTKTTDLNNCTTKVEQSIGMSYIDILPNCPLKEKMVKGTAVFAITLKYESAGDLITRVDSEQIYEVSPLNEADGAGVMIAKQELILSEVKNGPAQVPHVNWQDHGNIYYDFAKDSPPQIMIKPGNLKQQIEEILQGLDRSSIKDNSIKYLQLTQLCRRLDVAILHELYKSHANNRHA
ncbi:hypothetical protein lerEdw1_003934, partial [Lerista edwardsae]